MFILFLWLLIIISAIQISFGLFTHTEIMLILELFGLLQGFTMLVDVFIKSKPTDEHRSNVKFFKNYFIWGAYMKNLGVVTLQSGENVSIVTEKDLYDVIYNKLSRQLLGNWITKHVVQGDPI